MCVCAVCVSEFLILFEARAKLAQKWLVCVPLGIHLEPINKELMLLVRIQSKLTAPLAQRENRAEALWANGAPYELIKNTDVYVCVCVCVCMYMCMCVYVCVCVCV